MAHERKHQDNDELNLHIMKPWGKRVNNIITLALMRLFKGGSVTSKEREECELWIQTIKRTS